jgi:hypothetical protein
MTTPTPTNDRMQTVRALLIAVGLGAVLAYLFDPDRGRSRRALATDQIGGLARHTARRVERLDRRARAQVEGWRAGLQHLGPRGQRDPDDATLAARVQTELFRDKSVPKGRMNINVEHGVVVLRGTLDDASMAAAMERKIHRIPGVRGIRNLLREAGAEAAAR